MWTLFLLVASSMAAETNVFGPAGPPAVQPVVATISATGMGYPPRHMRGTQARLMAQRAAEVVAVRNLGRKLGLPPGSPVGPFRYVATRRLPNGAVEVTVEATLRSR